jgi:hypothetical protein
MNDPNMNDTQPHDSDGHDALRKLLKELPRVEASADFESRLARRIRESEPAPATRRRFAVPVFATSLLAILVAGVISYYTFFRVEEVIPPPATVPPASVRPTESAPAPAQSAPSDRATVPAAAAESSPAVREPAPRELPSRSAPAQKRSEESGVAPAEPLRDETPPVEVPEKAVQSERGLIQEDRRVESAAPAPTPLEELKKTVLPSPTLRELAAPRRPGRQETLDVPSLLRSVAAPSAVAPADTALKSDTTSTDSLRKHRIVPAPPRKEKRRRPLE